MEQLIFTFSIVQLKHPNHRVAGSSPAWGASFNQQSREWPFKFFLPCATPVPVGYKFLNIL